MSITKEFFGKTDAGEVYAYTLDNGKGLSAEILTRGGTIRRLIFNGTDVVLGREKLEGYIEDDTYFGALIGRNSNRIENCEFELNGRKYQLKENDKHRYNNLHGGPCGFDTKIWNVSAEDGDEPKLILTTTSKDGEEGFPANAEIKVTYTLTADNALVIHYEGEADGDTLMNMTNHAYFNLNGHDSGNTKGHTLQLNCSFFTPINDVNVPDGRVLSVHGTPFDFTEPKTLGRDLDMSNEQLKIAKGYDHNFAIDGRDFRKFAVLKGDKTGIVMECYTDRPAVQLYGGNWVDDSIPCKDGAHYDEYQGVCLETQVFPNYTKYSHFPSGILKKGEKYDSVTEYKFSME
ncbi:MAG: galactose mutarotase [Clostridiales bacterium]|nr:galactose mutarotase [Clostridiales bacterium]